MTALMTFVTIGIVLLALVATGMTAAADASVRLLGRGRIRRLAESGSRSAAALDALSARPGRVAAAHALVAGTSFATVAGVSSWLLLALWPGTPAWAAVLAAVLGSTVLVFVVGEALPRALAAANAEGAGMAAATSAARIGAVAYPIARLLSLPWRWLVSLISGERSPEVPWVEAEEARAAEDEADGLTPSEDLMEGVADLSEKIVREIMVPRTDMVCLEDTATIVDATRVITGGGLSRVPVFHETVDDIRGVLYAKDLLRCIDDDGCSRQVTDHMREPFFVPETKPVGELLREMRRRAHIAIVLDEYGGTAGLVTIEDLVEEIVGEIYDEYDQEVQLVAQQADGSYRIDARLPVDDLNELFDTAIEAEADTAGGLVSELAGHIPDVGESVQLEGLRFTIAEKEGNRVRQLRVEAIQHHQAQEGRS